MPARGGPPPDRPSGRERGAVPRRLRPAFVAASLAPLLPAVPAAAQDGPIDLADDPFQITDPRASAPGEVGWTVIGSYDRARRGRIRGTPGAETELEIGVAPRFEVRIGQAGAYGNLEIRRRLDVVGTDAPGVPDGDGPPAWGGVTQLGALYQLTEGRGALPTVGLLGRVRLNYGPGRSAYEAEMVALAGKTVVGGERPLGVNLNLGWTARLNPLPGERRGRYLLDASIGQTITYDTALVVAYAREQQERGDKDYSLVQVGLRQRLPAWRTVFGLAAGLGTNRDSPRFQIAFALQWQLGGGR